MADGSLRGNIIVQADGSRSEVDYHAGSLEKRIENYVIGKKPLVIETPQEVTIARDETLEILKDIFKRRGQKVTDIIARWRRLDSTQINELREWLLSVKKNARMLPNENYS